MGDLTHIFAEHWRFLLFVGCCTAVINTMPSPGQEGVPNNWIYRWIFMALHAMTFQWFRVAVVAFPQLKGVFQNVDPKTDVALPDSPKL